MSEQEPTIQIDRIIEAATRQGASDIHLHIGTPPTLRINGKLQHLRTKTLTDKDLESLFKSIAEETIQGNFPEEGQADFGFQINDNRFRVNVCSEFNGKAIILRAVPKIKTMEELNLPAVIKDMLSQEHGLILVTGATGSGKSTTLAAMIDDINKTCTDHIITVEDPIEFHHNPQKSIITQREVGKHVRSFASALKAAMREDPDVILIGEMRDEESVEATLRAAETGHLVLATLHSNTAATTINRIMDFFPKEKENHARGMLSSCLIGVISQTLMPRADGKGRVAAREILVCSGAVKNLIRMGKIEQISSQIQTGKPRGMITMAQSLHGLVTQKHISASQAVQKLSEFDLTDQTLQNMAVQELNGPS